MGEMSSLWGYEQSNHDMEQLGQKLLCTTLELEKLKAEAVDEMNKNKEYIKQLICLLKYTVQERDDARSQLRKLLSNSSYALPNNPLFSPAVKPAKANSGITDCNSPSDTYGHSSSPVDSFFDVVPSPGISNINLVASSQPPLAADSNVVLDNDNQVFDQGSLIIDGIVKGRALPEKGRFLQAVLQAGPLLQTLLVAGPLPRWRNPPQIQPLQIPPVSINGCDSTVFSQKIGQVVPRSVNNSQPYAQMSCGTAQVQAAPLLSSANFGSGGCLSNSSFMSSGTNCSGYSSLTKRQRLI